MNTFVERTFGALDRRWLARSYLIGALFLGICVALVVAMEPNPNVGSGEQLAIKAIMLSLLIVNTLLFPFAKLVWNSSRDFVLGDTILVSNAIFLLGAKLLVNMVLWNFAFLIAPVGMGYLWFKNRS